MDILLTGSRGTVGRHLAVSLERNGHRVTGFDLRADPDRPDSHHQSDLTDGPLLRRLLDGRDALIHAAAIPWDLGEPLEVMRTNVLGTWSVLQAAADAGVGRAVVFSSVNAQGSVGGHRPPAYLPIDDAHPHHPMTPYQLSKHLVEETCQAFSERYGMVTLCLRPVWITTPQLYATAGFGTEVFQEKWRPELWAYVDIHDVADAVERALAVDGVLHDRFLLSARDTSATQPTRDLVDRWFASVPWRATEETWPAGEPYRSLVDCHHAREVLGWEPRHSWRDSVEGTHAGPDKEALA
jgi:nucleoside-diphosphate-sugar epimerase